jgi:hypothetical protein
MKIHRKSCRPPCFTPQSIQSDRLFIRSFELGPPSPHPQESVAPLPLNEPKARGLAQHGGPPGWLEESDSAGAILHKMDGPYRLFGPVTVALTGAAQLRADGISSCFYIINVHNHPS